MVFVNDMIISKCGLWGSADWDNMEIKYEEHKQFRITCHAVFNVRENAMCLQAGRIMSRFLILTCLLIN